MVGPFGYWKPPGGSRGPRGQFSVQSDNRFSGRGGGGGEPPQGVAASWGANRLRRGLKNWGVWRRLFLRGPLVFRISRGRGGPACLVSHLDPGAFRFQRAR